MPESDVSSKKATILNVVSGESGGAIVTASDERPSAAKIAGGNILGIESPELTKRMEEIANKRGVTLAQRDRFISVT